MFIGHHGVAFAAKAVAPRANLGALFLATMWLDIMWPMFLLAGVEEVKVTPGITAVTPFDFVYYPYSHSLLFAILWGLLVARVMLSITQDGWVSAVCGFVVFSHWLLDLIVHRADLPIMPGADEKAGFGLWNSWSGTLTAEFVTFGGGLALYLWKTKAVDRIGTFALWALVVFLVAMYALSLVSMPPEDPKILAAGSLSLLLLVVWAGWADHHRAALVK